MMYFEGLRITDVARTLDKNPGTIQRHHEQRHREALGLCVQVGGEAMRPRRPTAENSGVSRDPESAMSIEPRADSNDSLSADALAPRGASADAERRFLDQLDALLSRCSLPDADASSDGSVSEHARSDSEKELDTGLPNLEADRLETGDGSDDRVAVSPVVPAAGWQHPSSSSDAIVDKPRPGVVETRNPTDDAKAAPHPGAAFFPSPANRSTDRSAGDVAAPARPAKPETSGPTKSDAEGPSRSKRDAGRSRGRGDQSTGYGGTGYPAGTPEGYHPDAATTDAARSRDPETLAPEPKRHVDSKRKNVGHGNLESTASRSIDRLFPRIPAMLHATLFAFRRALTEIAREHDRGRVHGSLSSENLRVDGSGSVRVEGWPAAAAREPSASSPDPSSKQEQSAAKEAAPETRIGAPATTQSDVYSLGVLLYELLTGVEPSLDSPSPPSSLAPHLPAELDAVLLRALSPEPADRYPTARELLAAIEDAV